MPTATEYLKAKAAGECPFCKADVRGLPLTATGKRRVYCLDCAANLARWQKQGRVRRAAAAAAASITRAAIPLPHDIHESPPSVPCSSRAVPHTRSRCRCGSAGPPAAAAGTS